MGAKRHFSGVSNELDTLAILQKMGVASKAAKHAGGTKQKADIVDSPKSFSVKLDTPSGWEWVNTTAVPVSISRELGTFFDQIPQGILPTRAQKIDYLVSYTTELFHECAINALDNCDREELKKFLMEKFVEPNIGLTCAVNNKKNRIMSCFDFIEHPVAKLLQDGWMPELVDTGASISRGVILTKDGVVVPANFRFTINFNNGIPALLGLKRTQTGGVKKSYLTAKIQQTCVPTLLKQVDAQRFSY